MSRITRSDIERVALLSRLSFSSEEADLFAEHLGKILGYVEKLDELDTSGVEPTSHPFPITNVFRDDEPRESLKPEQALANAPETESQCFRVPKIIQEA